MQASTYTATHHGHPECTPPAHEKWTPRSRTRLDSTRLGTLDLHTGGHRGPRRSWLAGWLATRSPGSIYLSPPDFSRCLTRLREAPFLLSALRGPVLSDLRIVSRYFAPGIESNARFRRAEILSWNWRVHEIISYLRKWLTSSRRSICGTFDACWLIPAAIKWF